MIIEPTTISNPMLVTNRFTEKHQAIDFKNIDVNGIGLPVMSINHSEFIRSGKTRTKANFIYVYDYEDEIFISYVHTTLTRKFIKGEQIKAGFPIGLSDRSGNTSTGIHLHLAMWDKDEKTVINPLDFFDDADISWDYTEGYRKQLIEKGILSE